MKGALPVIVCKFGGTSLCDATRFFRVADLIAKDSARRVVVPSAPGKRFAEDEKITDLLLQCYGAGQARAQELFAHVRQRYAVIAKELGFAGLLDEQLEQIQRRFRHESLPWALSRGEYLSGLLLAKLLDWSFLDAAQAVFFGADGRCDLEKTESALRAAMPHKGGLVLPGFYGAASDGSIRTFPRGGSDITGAIAARALGASLYENWTDVPGVLAADPRIVPQARVVESLSYRELRELSAMGAGVLQEEAVLPVREAGIPIAVRSTLDPSAPGTLIQPLQTSSPLPVTGVTGRRGFVPIMLEKTLLRSDPLLIQRALETLNTFRVPLEHMPSGVDTLCLLVPECALAPCREALQRALFTALKPDSIELGKPLALLAIVGNGMRGRRGVASQVLDALADDGIRVRMLNYGAGGFTLLIGVDEDDFEDGIRSAYRGAFSQEA